jgi:hypothetical protein
LAFFHQLQAIEAAKLSDDKRHLPIPAVYPREALEFCLKARRSSSSPDYDTTATVNGIAHYLLTMSSGFVSGGTIDNPAERDEAWLQAQSELEANRARKEAETQQQDGKSLYEVLQANKGGYAAAAQC